MAQLFLGMLVTYRTVKFVAWETMPLHPTCEALFRRIIDGCPSLLSSRLHDSGVAEAVVPSDCREDWEFD